MNSYPPTKQMVSHTAYPNGDVTTYSNGRTQYHLLPSNHPEVLVLKDKIEKSKKKN